MTSYIISYFQISGIVNAEWGTGTEECFFLKQTFRSNFVYFCTLLLVLTASVWFVFFILFFHGKAPLCVCPDIHVKCIACTEDRLCTCINDDVISGTKVIACAQCGAYYSRGRELPRYVTVTPQHCGFFLNKPSKRIWVLQFFMGLWLESSPHWCSDIRLNTFLHCGSWGFHSPGFHLLRWRDVYFLPSVPHSVSSISIWHLIRIWHRDTPISFSLSAALRFKGLKHIAECLKALS